MKGCSLNMNNDLFLSIIIPVYNAEKFIAECINSCLEQNISQTNYEIICINDGSTDRSLEILQDFASKYNNIIVANQIVVYHQQEIAE